LVKLGKAWVASLKPSPQIATLLRQGAGWGTAFYDADVPSIPHARRPTIWRDLLMRTSCPPSDAIVLEGSKTVSFIRVVAWRSGPAPIEPGWALTLMANRSEALSFAQHSIQPRDYLGRKQAPKNSYGTLCGTPWNPELGKLSKHGDAEEAM
jgi:hypothetical protein